MRVTAGLRTASPTAGGLPWWSARDRPDQPLQHLSERLGARILADSNVSVTDSGRVDNGSMARLGRVAALAALLGMGGLSLGSALVLSFTCCSPACEKCPIPFCRDASADTVAKFVAAPPAVVPSPVRERDWIHSEAPASASVAALHFVGFVRPMRN